MEPLSYTAEQLWRLEQSAAEELQHRQYDVKSKVKFILNPLDYAREPHIKFLSKYLTGPKSVLFVGLNPGPWGMCQTGLPFGEVNKCRDFLGITGAVWQPEHTPPKLKILGFDSTRREVSGDRFWSFVARVWTTAESFFSDCFIVNYCPLAFTTETGKNVTPAQFSSEDRKAVFRVCDEALYNMIRVLRATHIVAIGKVVLARVQQLQADRQLELRLHPVMHPSPANPAANKDWLGLATRSLAPLISGHLKLEPEHTEHQEQQQPA